MIPIQAALLVCPLLPTIAAQAPGLRDLEDPRAWRLFDRVEVIVNEEIVTVSQFDRDFREFVRATGMTATTPRETQEVSILVAQRKVDGLLTEQGGRGRQVRIAGRDKRHQCLAAFGAETLK